MAPIVVIIVVEPFGLFIRLLIGQHVRLYRHLLVWSALQTSLDSLYLLLDVDNFILKYRWFGQGFF